MRRQARPWGNDLRQCAGQGGYPPKRAWWQGYATAAAVGRGGRRGPGPAFSGIAAAAAAAAGSRSGVGAMERRSSPAAEAVGRGPSPAVSSTTHVDLLRSACTSFDATTVTGPGTPFAAASEAIRLLVSRHPAFTAEAGLARQHQSAVPAEAGLVRQHPAFTAKAASLRQDRGITAEARLARSYEGAVTAEATLVRQHLAFTDAEGSQTTAVAAAGSRSRSILLVRQHKEERGKLET